MFVTARLLTRVACTIALSACVDRTDPIAPRTEVSGPLPALSVAPTPEELAEMPPEFATAPSIASYWTNVGFLTGRAYATAYMRYFATDAVQEVVLDLRFENDQVGSTKAHGEDSNWLPWVRELVTTAYIGVSGTCGHLADGSAVHKAWHKFLVDGWKFVTWGTEVRSSADSAEQPACAPPPPPPQPPSGGGGGDGDGDYEGDCQLCQEWLYYIDGREVDRWWECEPIDQSYCEGLVQ